MSEKLPPMPSTYDDDALIAELAPVTAELFEQHLAASKPWYPHEFIPWSRGRDFVPGDEWNAEDLPLNQAVRSALFVNLLTEDNLPYYTMEIASHAPVGHPWVDWAYRWTAEERRHSEVIGGWVHAARALDPKELEDARMVQMSGGKVPHPKTMADALAYTSLQELATRVSHFNTGAHLSSVDKVGREILNRVATDEGLHTRFYRTLAGAAFRIDPSSMVIATARQVKDFEMPGTGIPNFQKHARAIAAAGIYDVAQFKEKVVDPTLETHWGIWDLDGLSSEAEIARGQLHNHLGRLSRVIRRQRERASE